MKKQKNIIKTSKVNNRKKINGILILLAISVIIGSISYFFTKSPAQAGGISLFSLIFLFVYSKAKEKLNLSNRIRKMESSFPDFLQLMSSNLRAGMTIDRALLSSSRKEFAPLDKEILDVGKDIITGKTMEMALKDMADKIGSEKIIKTVTLINSGIKSGGNIAVLLEETASNMRERDFVEKRAASNVLMYVIFVFFAVGIGAPALFALSNVLVKVLTQILSGLPDFGEVSSAAPFALSKISVSTSFITYFSVTFLIVTNILGSLVLGIVSKGEERRGIRYLLPLILISLIVFTLVRVLLGNYFANLIS